MWIAIRNQNRLWVSIWNYGLIQIQTSKEIFTRNINDITMENYNKANRGLYWFPTHIYVVFTLRTKRKINNYTFGKA